MSEMEKFESIGQNDFIDDPGGGIEIKRIRSGRGRVSGETKNGKELKPQILSAPGGRLGWRVTIPGSRPLVTPAVAAGKVYLGGGFGSYEFYCLDASTGNLTWKIKTKDDGPTAATVSDRYVAFNTESCTVYVVDAASGRVVWQEWLGDPLMAQTAIQDSTLFMAYPDRKRRHQLSAFDLETGRTRWQTELISDVISAPIVTDGTVYAATLEGTVYRIDAGTGEVHWAINHRATSAPWIHRGRLYMSLREEVEEEGKEGKPGRRYTTEGYDTAGIDKGVRRSARSSSRKIAEYLHFKADQNEYYAAHDASVGFAGSPSSAKIHMAEAHLGLGHVASVWAYQGSRPEVFDDGIFSVLDDVIQRLELGSKKPLWRCRIEADGTDGEKKIAGRTLSPPAVSESRLYVTSNRGDLFALDRTSGEELWSLNVGSPIISQPALAEGKVFLGTSDGILYAFQTDDPDPGGWPMWGGGPGHNGS